MWKVIDTWNDKEVKIYENFVNSHINGSFTQSIRWAKFKSNWKYEAIIVTDNDGKIKGSALILIKVIPVKTVVSLLSKGPCMRFWR